ncbi:MAG: hypothetical protein JW940_31040 [Polyangiaceae bacterium]|nr:hypothetical protein [Polyangiaceae bacterium]
MLTTTRTLLGLLVSLAGITACGSSSESGSHPARAGAAGQSAAAGTEGQDQSGGSMGEGGDGSIPDGTSSGGTVQGGNPGSSDDAGSGGSAGRGADTGTSGGLGRGGETATGGSMGQGGDSERSGGAGHSGDTGPGGSGEPGGAATDSDSEGGAGGVAGSGSGDAVAVGCGKLCSHADDCPNDTEAECLVRCGVLGSKDECNDEYAAFADCLETAEFGCNADGQVSVVGCEGTAAAAVGCIAGIEPDLELAGPCEDYCDGAVAAQCEKTESKASCVNGCTLFGAKDFPCSSQWNNVLTCSDGATFECNDNGNAVPSGCNVQVLAFGACVVFGVGASS